MSDFYDSLEDEGNEGEISSGFLDHFRSDLSDKSISSQSDSDADDSNGRKKFCIDITRERTRIFCSSRTSRNLKKVTRSEDNFLPIIERRREVRDSKNDLSYINLDNELLCKQGLQLNRDGGITKSPRTEVEELPFVTREYRSSIFQNKKPFEVRKRAPAAKVNRKNIFTFKENPTNEISMVTIINAREKKGSSEEILTSGGSRCSSKESSTKVNKDFDNLTDSMKEMILRKQSEGAVRKKSEEKVKGLNSETQKKSETKSKPQKLKLLSRRSEFDLKLGRTNLSYVERRQKEKGFNPLSLRLESKKSPSETARSNFGDPVTDRLSDVSSGVPNISYAEAEDEARFYEQIIQMEKNMAKIMSKSSRSATPVEDKKIKEIDGFHSCKEKREAKSNEKTIKFKNLGKSTSIDLPLEDNKKRICKKSFHYCKIDASKGVSKTELAMRARAYGSMANARNIFKLKTQSENKINSIELQKGKCSSKGVSGTDVEKRSSGTLIREKSTQSKVFAKTSKSLNKANSFVTDGDFSKGFAFPPLSCLSETDKNLKTEVLRRIGSCLDGSYIDGSYLSLPNLVNEVYKSDTH